MKGIKSILVVIFFSASSFATEEITYADASAYSKAGYITLTQDGIPEVGYKEIIAAASKKCDELNIRKEECFYRIIGSTGQETNHKDINIDILKKAQ